MNQVLWGKLVELISEHIGFYIKVKDYPSLQSKIETRINTLQLSNIGDYYKLLQDSIDSKSGNICSSQKYRSKREWNALANIITNGESFFFRDRGQFNLLEQTLIPQLVEKKKKFQDFNLKIWSSGCSTGQEPYSLAILLDRIIPDLSQWNINVIGTDINQNFLNKARIGIYQDWSFRLTNPLFKKSYFTSTKQGWKINNNIRNLVEFYQDNIVQDQITPIPCCGVDLIVCRNVFIYFKKASVAKGINKFYTALNSGGYFMTGHAELQGITLNQFEILSFPESVIYQKPENGIIADNSALLESKMDIESIETNLDTNISLLSLNPDSDSLELDDLNLNSDDLTKSPREIYLQNNNQSLEAHNLIFDRGRSSEITPSFDGGVISELESLLAQEKYDQVIQQGQKINEQQSDKHLIYYLIAQAYAKQNNLVQAEIYCQKALDIDSIFVPALYLLAEIAQTKNNLKKAKEFLKRIIYLEPSSVIAYVELGSVYTKDADLTRANKMYHTAYKILQDLPSEQTFDHGAIITVNQLITRVEEELSKII